MPFYIRKIKWTTGNGGESPKVIISDFGPFAEKEDCQVRLTSMRKHKNSDYSIIEKENHDS